jgi:hypothetical protein
LSTPAAGAADAGQARHLPGTFYRWYNRFQTGGPEALEDRSPTPRQVWNRIPDDVREQIVELALDAPELSPRELATRFTDTKNYFVSEASVYRLLKAHDLIMLRIEDATPSAADIIPDSAARSASAI